MSIINSDQEKVNKGRKNKLQDVEASLRDQIPKKLYKKLKEKEVGQRVVEAWRKINADRVSFLERQQVYLKGWDEFLTADAEGPFQGSSNLHLPMPFIVCKTYHARMLQAILDIDPPFSLKARREDGVDRQKPLEDLMRYCLLEWMNYRKGVEEAVDTWVWNWITQGTGVLKTRWDVKYTRYIDVIETEQADVPLVEFNENGKERLVPRTKLVEEEQEVTKKCFEGPVAEWINVEDFGQEGGEDPDQADVVIHRQWLSASDMYTLVDRKIFDADAVEKVISGGAEKSDNAEYSGIVLQRAQNAGKAEADTNVDNDRYEILEAYLKMDVDGSGINSDVVVWVAKKSRELLHATYLYRMNKAGERPFAVAHFHKRPGQSLGVGLPEILYPLTTEMDAMHNMRIDFGILSTMPFGFYRASSSINPETINIEPGALIPVDDPSAVYFPQLGNRTSFGMQEEMALQTMVERLTGISDMSLGVMSGSQGATRTATGARALIGEANSNINVHLRRLNRAWKKTLKNVFHLLQQKIEPGFAYRITGDDGQDYFRYIRSQKDIEGDFDFELSSNSANSNKSVQIEQAGQIMQMTGNPLDIQLGIITPAQRYNAIKNYLVALGIKDFSRYINKPQGVLWMVTPEEEANRLLRGIDVPITPEMDHEGFIKFVEYIMQNDELLGQFSQAEAGLLQSQALKHAQMIEALKQMQAQQANAMQMQRNAAMSAEQTAPVQSGPIGGPVAEG